MFFPPFLPTPVSFEALAMGSLRTYDMKVGINQLESLRYPTVQIDDPVVIIFDALSTCGRQTDKETDRQTDTPPIAKSRSVIAERDKNKLHTATKTKVTGLTVQCGKYGK